MSKKKKIDLHRGGKVKCENGKVLKVKPHSERTYLALWRGNGAMIETLAYSKKVKGEVNSDRIHLIIRDGNGKKQGWLMNIEDAEHIIEGLICSIRLTGIRGVPRSGK